MKIEILEQVSVFMKNETGVLANITEVLAAENINIRAFSSYDTPDFNIARMILSEPEQGVQSLEQAGFFCSKTAVLGLALDDQPGSLHQVFAKLAAKEIPITYTYSLVWRGADTEKQKPFLIVDTTDLEAAKEALANE